MTDYYRNMVFSSHGNLRGGVSIVRWALEDEGDEMRSGEHTYVLTSPPIPKRAPRTARTAGIT